MKREVRSREIRRKIVDATNDLIWEKGYQQTTVREITKKAGVNTGTLYHYFHDKEEILLVLAAKAYNNMIEVAEQMTQFEHDKILTFMLIRALEFRMWEKYPNASAIARDMYESWRITKRVMPMDIERNKIYFRQYTKAFTDQDYYVTTLASRGIRFSFATECHREGATAFKKKWPLMIKAEFRMLNVPQAIIEKNLRKVQKLLNKKSISIRGLKL